MNVGLKLVVVLLAGVLLLVAGLRFFSHSRPPTPDGRAPSPWVVASPSEGVAPLRVRFDGSGSTDDVGITSYRWDFGEGRKAEGMIVDEVFVSAGTYEVTLTVSDASGNSRSSTTHVAVRAPVRDTKAPLARIAVHPFEGVAPFSLPLDASGSSDDRGVVRWRWRIDGLVVQEGPLLEHVFALPGTYQVSVEVFDAAGQSSMAQTKVTVTSGAESAPPVSLFTTSSTRVTAPAEVFFDGSESSDDRSIVLYRWQFGDGAEAEGARVTHRYSRTGQFTASLTVFDDSAQAHRSEVLIEVEAPVIVSERVLFDDEFAPGVSDGSWARVRLVQSPVRTGKRALEVTAGAHGAMRLAFAPQSLAPYDRLGFWIYGENVETLSVRALWQEGGNEVLGPPVALASHLLAGRDGQASEVWRRAGVPLSNLDAEGRQVTGLLWQASDAPTQSPFVLDAIELLPPDRELPAISDCLSNEPVRGFVERQGSTLLVDSVPVRLIGANVYYAQELLSRHVQTGELRPLARVREAMSTAACAGVTVLRLHAFNESPPETQGLSVIQRSPGEWNEAGLLGLDLAVAEAKAQHLRVILTLANNWSHYGGLPRYASWAGVSVSEAVSDARVRRWYLDYAAMLASRTNVYTGVRYQDEAAIFAVELVNELRCRGCAPGRDATAFMQALAPAVKELWPNHLISDGGEGFDPALSEFGLGETMVARADEGMSFSAIAAIPAVDLASYHLYPSSWRLDEVQAGLYIDAHEQLATRARKVPMLGEFGSLEPDQPRSKTYESWLDRVFALNSGSLAFVWQITYAARADNDNFAINPILSPQTLASLARQASFLKAHGKTSLPD